MTKDEILEFFEIIADEAVDDSIKDALFVASEKAIYNNRDWWFLRSRASQSTNQTANADFVSADTTNDILTMSLPSNFQRPLEDLVNRVPFVSINGTPYALVDNASREYLSGRCVFVDYENS